MIDTVIWQLTRTCDLGCNDCLSVADPFRANPHELTTFEAYKTIDQIAALRPRRLIITGGDPLTRADVFELVQYARRRGLDPALNVSPTHKLTAESVSKLRRNGLRRLVFGLNGSSTQRHDLISGVFGSFSATLRGLRWAHDAGLSIEVNTLVTRKTVGDLGAIAELIDPFGVDAWNVHFLVPFPGSLKEQAITAEQTEEAFAALSAIASLARYRVRVVEAPHFRRYLMRQMPSADESWSDFSGFVGNAEAANDVVFITSTGDVRPSEFLPLSGGNVRETPLPKIVRSSDLFVALRDRSNLSGKCRRCDYRKVCGGSRARAWAVTGDLFASDPLCTYQPPAKEVAV
jgi:radical SAM protein with 4Fe4S-binding SPASM domain